MEQAPSLQQVIMRLHEFWSKQGCLIWQPYNTEVGAGTLNPATALRVLGPEPWNVAYVEPSSRAADGRYGENPNRWQQYYQFQVILKPDPGNPMELYLGSLEALGIDLSQHDIRFVEDNWASPALGAWGLGWEVWLDGQEITQFTYFQQAGGIDLEPVSVEITYGLERIVMYLQQVDGFPNIRYSDDRTYGDVLLRSEIEACKYNFDYANIERLTKLYDLYEQEAQNALENGLVVPAHNYVLKCSHAFNLLDARGAVGVTERARFFARMKALSQRVARAYLDQRQEMGFPWLKPAEAVEAAPAAQPAAEPDLSQPRDFLLEIGMEELPVEDQTAAIAQLQESAPKMLADARLDHQGIRVVASPRHVAVYVNKLAPRQRDEERLVKGPPAQIAFDAAGNPTKAALGFARGAGVGVEALRRQEFDGKAYLVATVADKGQPTPQVLAELLPKLLGGLSFPLSMRWNATQIAFSRPLRWLVALWGDQVIGFTFAGVSSGKVSRGLRSVGSPDFTIARAEDYAATLAAQSIIVDQEARRRMVWQQVTTLASAVGGAVEESPSLLAEVANLVEYPTAILGRFDPAYLELPKEVLIAVMQKHQRYFPVQRDGQLLPYFITIANGKRAGQQIDIISHGNEAVIRARYADAAFFFQSDRRTPLSGFLPKLDTLTFQAKLGSMKDKTDRLLKLAPALADGLGIAGEDRELALRIAGLAKADLVTQMVVEHTSLQGVMGRYYAQMSGEPAAVAEGIEQHYWPRFAGDKLPSTTGATLVSLADRLDSLVGLFAVGLGPTGSADRYGLRRQALGLAQTLVGKALDLDLTAAIAQAAALQPVPVSEAQQREVADFIAQRVRIWWLDEGYRYDLVDAALGTRANTPYRAYQTLTALARWVEQPAFAEILTAYSRPSRITRELAELLPIEAARLSEPAERALYAAYQQAESRMAGVQDVDGLLAVLAELKGPIAAFFADVFVMVDDPAVRTNRLALLQRIARLAAGIVDLTKVQGY